MPEKKYHAYNEAGRRLRAALISYQAGRSGVDYTLRQTPEYAGDGWAEIAERLLTLMNEFSAKKVLEFPKTIQ